MTFSDKEAEAMQLFYNEEKIRLSAQLKHIDKILRKFRSAQSDGVSEVLLTKEGVKAKKRGPKSIWGKFILDELEESNRPLSYTTLVNRALDFKNLDVNSAGLVRASILNSAFRLRSIHGNIATVGQFGKKEKFLILASWLDKSGAMSQKHQELFRQISGGAPELVDLSKLPQPRYEED